MTLLLLGMMTLMPSLCFSGEVTDSAIIHRIWNYRRNFSQDVKGVEQNVYMRNVFNVEKRNVLLFLVPTMYSLARGNHQFITEAYGKFKFRDLGDYDFHRQVVNSTIPHNRTALTPVHEFMTPNLYDVTLYPEYLLSPFHRSNRRSYKYRFEYQDNSQIAIVHFTPRLQNTQFVSGYAAVNIQTGRIQFACFEGEYDMISFRVTAFMGQEDKGDLLPARCFTNAKFNFLGNRIKASFASVYHCPESIPDSISDKEDPELMARLRPIPLYSDEKKIYALHEQAIKAEEQKDERKPRRSKFVSAAWNIGDNLINSHFADNGSASIDISPLLNPLYMSYSQSKGLSYLLDIGMRYAWNSHRYLTLMPRFGYNFKQKQFYYTAPLRMTYNPKRNGYVELTWANGNRTSNGTLEDSFHKVMGDTIDMPYFKDMYLQLVNNVVAYDWLEITTGMVFHRRSASDNWLMEKAKLPTEYKSFAPVLTLKFTPWQKGPTLTANYERCLRNVLSSNLEYERWEFDASLRHKLRSLRTITARVGTGFYTRRSTDYFVDYTNFRDNYLPTDWNDEWSGQFQVLEPRWYNESDYYLRSHFTYESPQLLLTRLPLVGRFIESERVYVSALSIEHTRPYYELGYGLTNRLFSAGVFVSMLGQKFYGFSSRFTIELFRRW